MDFARKMGKYLVAVLLPAVAWLIINSYINGHYHKLNNGITVYHAHPYDKQNDKSSPLKSHHHNNLEYFLLGLITNPVFLLSIGILAFSIFRQHSEKIITLLNWIIPEKKIYPLFNNRAPPIISF